MLNPSAELCQFRTVPTLPLSVRRPLVLPLQIVEPPLIVPPTVVALTVTVVEAELATKQVPL